MWPFNPQSVPPGFGEGKVVPEEDASCANLPPSQSKIDTLPFQLPLKARLSVGAPIPHCWLCTSTRKRRYEICWNLTILLGLIHNSDLWELPTSRLTKEIADSLERHFYLQSLRKAPEHPQLDNKDGQPAAEEPDTTKTSPETQEADVEAAAAPPFNKKRWYQFYRSEAPTGEGQKNTPSLLRALHRQFFYRWWFAGILRLTAGECSRGQVSVVVLIRVHTQMSQI
jgi:ATP-binding cassette, subfamily C (CFTR/MRP), member 1